MRSDTPCITSSSLLYEKINFSNPTAKLIAVQHQRTDDNKVVSKERFQGQVVQQLVFNMKSIYHLDLALVK
jgi:hypothetical protein